MCQQLDLSIILPAYLEEENLRLLLPRINKNASSITPNFEILVVDTEKPLDGTHDACIVNNVKYLNRKGQNTYGAAVRSGISEAKGKKIIFMDADGSHHPEFIKELYFFKDVADVVVASRYIEGGRTENSRYLIIMSQIVNFGYSFILQINCKDISNSFKLYDGDSLRKISLKCENFDIVEEILYKISKQHKNLVIKEIPFTFKQRMFGQSKRNLIKFVVTYVITLFKLRFFN